jgi:hypothetical protein
MERSASRPALAAAVVAACCVSLGCASLTVVPAEALDGEQLAPDATPVAHIHSLNWGWYLFKFIPIITGNLEQPGYPQWPAWFTDNVSVEDVVGKVSQKAHELGGTRLSDLRTTDRSGWEPQTLVFWLNEIEVSANVSK